MSKSIVMNGTDRVTEISVVDRKPIVTYAGDKELFLSLESTLCSSLPNEQTEWRRSYGRPVKMINVAATFVPFTKDALPKEGPDGYKSLIDQPVFHTYWTQCSDVDTYKSSIKDDIELWMRVLLQYNLAEWMIVLVETYDFKKSNKLLSRTTVYDKIKSDFGAKHADRCLSVINPLRSESRSAGSWRGLVVNTRLLLLSAFDRLLIKLEETIREQREKRIQPGWSFTKFFLLQEELAFVLEMLGVYEEALVQYDESDAIFTQFVLNSNLGETPPWLTQFQSPLDTWDGLGVTSGVNLKERERIENNTASLLQFRNYLFSRQCAMLLYANKPSEVAERTLPYLHNCIRELSLLEVSHPQGAVACWVLLSCIEILEICEKYKEKNYVEQYSRFTAGIWAYARQKLAELGQLCGLMPGQKQTSEQLHISVQIFSGLRDDFTKPIEKLKKALTCQREFTKQYLELSELAMGTYKHIGRVRCARSLGLDLAKFYWSIEDYATATSFLQNALLCYEQDGWKHLAANTRLQLAQSYLKLGDLLKYAKMCLSIACTEELEEAVRLSHFDEVKKTLDASNPDPPWSGTQNDCLSVTDVDVQVDQGARKVTVILDVICHLPVETKCPLFSVAVVPTKHDSKSSKHRDLENSRRRSKEHLAPVNTLLQRLPVTMRLDYQQDKSLARASVDIKHEKSLLRRTDSHGKYRKISTVTKADFTISLYTKYILLKPGVNKIVLTSQEIPADTYRLTQFSLMLTEKLELLSLPTTQKIYFEVVHTLPTIALNTQTQLLAGLPQTTVLQITSHGYHINDGSLLHLSSSSGLLMHQAGASDSFNKQLTVKLPEVLPSSTFNTPLSVHADLPPYKETSSIVHSISIETPWAEEEELISLQLQPALSVHLRLHTAKSCKFLYVTVSCRSNQNLSLHDPAMSVLSPPNTTVSPLNPPNSLFVLTNENRVCYMWSLETSADDDPVKTEFSLYYEPLEGEEPDEPLFYKCVFDIANFGTLYTVECKVDPVRGSEFCRVSTVCQLTIKVSKISQSEDSSLMYKVFAEQNMWVVCGKDAGILLWEENMVEQTVTVDVMPLVNGYLPLPKVRLSKYFPAKSKVSPNNSARLEQFNHGQVYNLSKGSQVHVITAASLQEM